MISFSLLFSFSQTNIALYSFYDPLCYIKKWNIFSVLNKPTTQKHKPRNIHRTHEADVKMSTTTAEYKFATLVAISKCVKPKRSFVFARGFSDSAEAKLRWLITDSLVTNSIDAETDDVYIVHYSDEVRAMSAEDRIKFAGQPDTSERNFARNITEQACAQEIYKQIHQLMNPIMIGMSAGATVLLFAAELIQAATDEAPIMGRHIYVHAPDPLSEFVEFGKLSHYEVHISWNYTDPVIPYQNHIKLIQTLINTEVKSFSMHVHYDIGNDTHEPNEIDIADFIRIT